ADAAGRQGDRVSAVERIGKPRSDDRVNLLMRAIELHALLVRLRIEPVEEHSGAGANGGRAALERRPGEAAARREIEAADVRLHFLADAGADSEILPHADVVLNVDAELRLRDRDAR